MRHVLLVDDDEFVLEVIRDMLEMAGYRVTALHDSTEALKLIKKESFDLVLTDLRMPGANGLVIAKATNEREPHIPVILFSGWAAHYDDGEDLAGKGVDLLLAKPIAMEALLKNVDGLLSDETE
ncbi:MAG: response regulator [Desulfoferrobacter sp.]